MKKFILLGIITASLLLANTTNNSENYQNKKNLKKVFSEIKTVQKKITKEETVSRFKKKFETIKNNKNNLNVKNALSDETKKSSFYTKQNKEKYYKKIYYIFKKTSPKNMIKKDKILTSIFIKKNGENSYKIIKDNGEKEDIKNLKTYLEYIKIKKLPKHNIKNEVEIEITFKSNN